MRNAGSLTSLADCLRPGFARHRALSRAARSWTAAISTSRQRCSDDAWGLSTLKLPSHVPYGDQPASEDGITASDSQKPPYSAANGPESSNREGSVPSYTVSDNIDVVETDRSSYGTSGRAEATQASARDLRHWQKVEDRLTRNKADREQQLERERALWSLQGATPNSYLYEHHQDLKATSGAGDLRRFLDGSPLSAIYGRMRFAASRGEAPNVHRMAAYLLQERGERPNTNMYACMILSHCSATNGSAHWVRSLLEEMRAEGVDVDSGICHDVLKVLSVHPDFLLRAETLDYMERRWFTLSDDGQHDVAASLFRDGQLELGIEALENMSKQGVHVQEWLHDMATHILCNAGEFEEALRILRHRSTSTVATTGDVSPVIWWRLLDTASSAFHYEGTRYVWKLRVQPGFLNPSSGTCLNVLKIAARRGDVDLATDVFRVLGERGTVFEAEHYELLMDAYIIAKDMNHAFSLLCVMHDTGADPDLGTVRGLVYHLRYSHERRQKAWTVLEELAKVREVPAIAMNALVEAAVAGNELDEAVEYYKCMHDICKEPSRNVDTFNILLRGCRSAARKEVAMFLAAEMVALGITPTALTYDRLILICLMETDFEDAFRYYFEMVAQAFKPRLGTLFFLAKRAADSGDSRTSRLLEDMDAFGELAQRPKRMVEDRLKAAEEAPATGSGDPDEDGKAAQQA